MKQEDKELLLKDLCARLPYRTMVKCNTDGHHEFDEELSEIHIMNFYQFEIKPYLRSMSSMTKEEYEEYYNISYGMNNIGSKYKYYDLCDWFNKHHFDYRGLIEKGLAIKVTEENNPYERE